MSSMNSSPMSGDVIEESELNEQRNTTVQENQESPENADGRDIGIEQDEEEYLDEDGAEDFACKSNQMSGKFMEFGAHRQYEVPLRFILSEASHNFHMRDGAHLGEVVASKGAKNWLDAKGQGLHYTEVSIVGGPSTKRDGQQESAPFVCFTSDEAIVQNTDDSNWLRPVPEPVMKYYQPKWIQKIEEKYVHNPAKKKRIFEKYRMVLEWKKEDCNGQRLHPEHLGTGDNGFRLLPSSRKLRTIRTKALETTPNSGSLCKLKRSVAGASTDVTSDAASDITQVPEARVFKIGRTEKTNIFEKEGIVFATVLE